MSRIRILAETVANKIAAGEVVERPASVVKELLENSLDAGAKSVRVEVESGGKRLIRIIDDGCGMLHDDALLAFERHATSKLRNADDLLSISTLGFRGEALPSIAAVSRLTLETRAPEEQGTRLEFAGGKLVSVKPAGAPAGTAIHVEDLFYCVPARRKFLKSETTELGHIASLVTHYALAHPDKQFLLKTPTQEILNATPVETMAERVHQVFGRQAAAEMVEMAAVEAPIRAAITEPELEPGEEAAKIRISGFVSRPEIQRVNRNGIYIFVNRRLIRDRLVLHAINEAYRNIVPPGVFPAVLVFLELPYDEVDVNVHPAKIEVRFRHSQVVHDFVRDAIRMALSNARPVPSFPAAAVSAKSEAAFAAGVGAGPAGGTNGGAAQNFAASAATAAAREAQRVEDFSGAGIEPTAVPVPPSAEFEGRLEDAFVLSGAPDRPIPQRLNFEAAEGIEIPSTALAPGDACEQPSLVESEMAGALPSVQDIGSLKPLGQINASYIVAVNTEGLWIIDQHVAHERVLFEKHLAARRAGAVEGQRLLMPMVAELTPRQMVIFEQIAEELRANGFEAEMMGPRSVAISAAPAGVSSTNAEKLLAEILDGVARESQAISLESLQARIAASTACQAAIKVNMPLDQTKMEWLLAQLAKAEYPMSCPHGRPIVLRYSVREIERAFKRI